jgi:hypothetical protein
MLAVVGCARQDTALTDVAQLLDLDDKPFDLWTDSSAPATVVVFTRGDCPISNRYAPEVRRLCEEFQPRGVRFFLVYVDPQETAESVRAHLAEYEYSIPGLRDPRHGLVEETGATVTPEAVVFDSERKIAYRGRIDNLFADFGKARPAATTHELADAIAATLAGEPVAAPETKAVGCYIGDLK